MTAITTGFEKGPDGHDVNLGCVCISCVKPILVLPYVRRGNIVMCGACCCLIGDGLADDIKKVADDTQHRRNFTTVREANAKPRVVSRYVALGHASTTDPDFMEQDEIVREIVHLRQDEECMEKMRDQPDTSKMWEAAMGCDNQWKGRWMSKPAFRLHGHALRYLRRHSRYA